MRMKKKVERRVQGNDVRLNQHTTCDATWKLLNCVARDAKHRKSRWWSLDRKFKTRNTIVSARGTSHDSKREKSENLSVGMREKSSFHENSYNIPATSWRRKATVVGCVGYNVKFTVVFPRLSTEQRRLLAEWKASSRLEVITTSTQILLQFICLPAVLPRIHESATEISTPNYSVGVGMLVQVVASVIGRRVALDWL